MPNTHKKKLLPLNLYGNRNCKNLTDNLECVQSAQSLWLYGNVWNFQSLWLYGTLWFQLLNKAVL